MLVIHFEILFESLTQQGQKRLPEWSKVKMSEVETGLKGSVMTVTNTCIECKIALLNFFQAKIDDCDRQKCNYKPSPPLFNTLNSGAYHTFWTRAFKHYNLPINKDT